MKLLKITGGIFTAGALLWLAGLWFCNSPFIMVPHDDLQTMGYPDGCRIVWRTEGRGVGTFGRWGVSAVPDVQSRTERKIILWGDSYVEAHQVSDGKKMAQQLTDVLMKCGIDDVLAVGAGFSGQSVADYLVKIPVYEKKMPPVAAHVVVIGQIEDLFPNNPPAYFSRFVADPVPHVIPAVLHKPSRLKWVVYQWGVRLRANGFLSMVRNWADGFNLRFEMGPVKMPQKNMQDTKPSDEELDAWFNFYAREFRKTTAKPLILVYLPTVPKLNGNGWILDDGNDSEARQMEEAFSRNGWLVINMGGRFVRYFEETGQMPRGFNNSSPGSGHLNEAGHKLVAEALSDCLLKGGYFDFVPTTDNR